MVAISIDWWLQTLKLVKHLLAAVIIKVTGCSSFLDCWELKIAVHTHEIPSKHTRNKQNFKELYLQKEKW